MEPSKIGTAITRPLRLTSNRQADSDMKTELVRNAGQPRRADATALAVSNRAIVFLNRTTVEVFDPESA
jgi:hypothetical protein